MAQVQDVVARGTTVVVGRISRRVRRADDPHRRDPAMRAYHGELFGPSADVHRVTDDAVALASDSPYVDRRLICDLARWRESPSCSV
jgi:acyl-CoA reductase-like NAD-dependent aldehyde dehydrogenase